MNNIEKIDILAIGAHPDDVELGCGATLAKEIATGKKIGILDLTRGELGTRGTEEIREQEAEKAAAILQAKFRLNLGLPDGFFVNNKESQLKIVEIIRKYRPDIILCNPMDDRHPDHGKAGKLVSDACFLTGLRKVETVVDGISQAPWRPLQVYHYIQWKHEEPDFVVDVSGYIKKKIEAVFAFASQFGLDNRDEPGTVLTSENFKDSILYRAKDLGRLTGVAYGEGFTVERYPLVNSVFDLK